MSLRGDLNRIAPRLRRCATALVSAHPGPDQGADALVAGALRQVFVDGASLTAADLEVEAYAALIDLNREHIQAAEFGGPSHGASALIKRGGSHSGSGRPPERQRNFSLASDELSSALLALKLEDREALLLVALEGLTYARAARVLRISRSILVARLARARESLPGSLQAPPSSHRARPRPPHLRLVK